VGGLWLLLRVGFEVSSAGRLGSRCGLGIWLVRNNWRICE
jgi:hypothetical protein